MPIARAVRPMIRRSLLGFVLLLAAASAGRAQPPEIRIAQQFGISYLPFMVMKERHLLEQFARQAGLAEPVVTWAQFSGAAAMNDALLSGNLDIASGGVGPLVTLWSRTAHGVKVRAIAALGSIPNELNTNRPDIHSLRDFTDQDRIALPSVGVGFQSVVLEMAAEQAFGPGQSKRLDSLTISMPHPDAAAALLSGRSEITAHFTSPPFQQQEREDPRVHRVLSSYDVLGGPHSFNLLWCTTRFHDANPALVGALIAGLDAAMDFITSDPRGAAELYVVAEKSKLPLATVQALITAPENRYTTVPESVMKFAEFQYRTGQVKERAADWKDLFFPELHDRPGS